MKYLGIDYGTKRIGLALSDSEGLFARPLKTIENNEQAIKTIESLIEEEAVGTIVIGESRDQKGKHNPIEEKISDFIGILTLKTFLPIERVAEAYSSFEAHTREGKEQNISRKQKIKQTKDLDAKAAAIILQRHLDINKQ